MTGYVIRRLLQSALLLVLVVTAVFLIFQVMPGDITSVMIDPETPPEARQALIERLGLDRPVHERLVIYLEQLARGDLGSAFPTATFRGGRPVVEIISERLPRTILLFVVVVVLNYLIGFLLGKQIAWRRGTTGEFIPTAIGVWSCITPSRRSPAWCCCGFLRCASVSFHSEAGRSSSPGALSSSVGSPRTMCSSR